MSLHILLHTAFPKEAEVCVAFYLALPRELQNSFSTVLRVVSCLDAFQTPVDNTVLFQGQHLHCLRHLRRGDTSRLRNIKLVVTHRPGGK